MAAKIVDAKGIPCPQPVIKAKQAMREMEEGILEVLVDNEIAVSNLIKLGNYSNMMPASEKLGNQEFKVTFQIKAQECGKQLNESEEEACIPVSCKAGTVVVLSSDQMGEGGTELGRILMKGFIYALTQLDIFPDTILLYNGGAKLSSEGSESVEDLKQLETQGVEILTCGTCLNYYGLSEKLFVGSVTNMYEIAERLVKAESIICP